MTTTDPNTILPILPNELEPHIVTFLDQVRFALEEEDDCEVAWFLREYPRIFRYHSYHAWSRLAEIHAAYVRAGARFKKRLEESPEGYALSEGRGETHQIYWNFEAYLGAVSSALDTIARILTAAHVEHTPVSFNKLCSRTDSSPLFDILREAKKAWVDRTKDYRDCFVLYTPIDHEPRILMEKHASQWRIQCPLPRNPNAREISDFRFRPRLDLLVYSLDVFENLRKLDVTIARELSRMRRAGRFPTRRWHLFHVGRRDRESPSNKALQRLEKK
jgi:hypothetical protein